MEKQMESKHSLIAEYYTECYDDLKAFVASRLTGNEVAEQAEDIVQNVFVRLLKMDKMINPITLPCLVYTTARNLLCDYWRRKQYRDWMERTISMTGMRNESVDDAAMLYSAKEIEKLLEESVAHLSEQQAKVYRLSFYDDMKVGEIAKELNMKYKNAERSLGIARKNVRCEMQKVLAS